MRPVIRIRVNKTIDWIMVSQGFGLPTLAHTQSTGLGAFIDGAEQFWIEPTDLLLSLALCCLAVQQTSQRALRTMILLPACWTGMAP